VLKYRAYRWPVQNMNYLLLQAMRFNTKAPHSTNQSSKIVKPIKHNKQKTLYTRGKNQKKKDSSKYSSTSPSFHSPSQFTKRTPAAAFIVTWHKTPHRLFLQILIKSSSYLTTQHCKNHWNQPQTIMSIHMRFPNKYC